MRSLRYPPKNFSIVILVDEKGFINGVYKCGLHYKQLDFKLYLKRNN